MDCYGVITVYFILILQTHATQLFLPIETLTNKTKTSWLAETSSKQLGSRKHQLS
jgi:hypothetical protein